jgi:hypothetical protein
VIVGGGMLQVFAVLDGIWPFAFAPAGFANLMRWPKLTLNAVICALGQDTEKASYAVVLFVVLLNQ